MLKKLALLLPAVALLFCITGFTTIVKKKKKAKAAPKTVSKKKKAVRPSVKLNTAYSMVVSKKDYELQVFDADGWLATYPVVFGNKDQSDKKMRGDRLTPEGSFRVVEKRSPYKWHRLMMLDYPNGESLEKFRQRKANGEIPSNASVGDGIAIHGTWPGSDWVVENYVNWTDGCISMRNEDLEELYEMIPLYTRITIRP